MATARPDFASNPPQLLTMRQPSRRNLLACNELRIGPATEQSIQVVVRDNDGIIVAGVIGVTRG